MDLLLLEHLFVLIVVLSTFYRLCQGDGLYKNVAKNLIGFFKQFKVVQGLMSKNLEAEAAKTIQDLTAGKPKPEYGQIPKQGESHEKLLKILQERAKQNLDCSEGRAWAYVYDVSEKHNEFTAQAYNMFVHTNYLNPMKYISLRNMEVEIINMTSYLLHGDSSYVGSVTSGGSESILLAVKAYRDYFLRNNPHGNPEMIVCTTVHPAFNKAASVFRVKLVYVDCHPETKLMRHDHVEKLITKNTIAIIGSAPQFPHGVIDPITELGKIGLRHNIPVHVDAAIGGWVLPWIEKLGYEIPAWDFRVPGVQSVNLDIHKYGFAPKGSSCLIFRDNKIRNNMFFSYSGWSGGLYISPTLMGSRNGGAISAAWASIMALGESGYLEAAKEMMETQRFFVASINKSEDLKVLAEPHSTLVSFTSKNSSLNIYHVSDAMDELGWHMERQQDPASLHCSIMPQHTKTRDQFIKDLFKCVEIVKQNPDKYKTKSAAMYGMVASIPDGSIIDDFLLSFMDKMYSWNGPKQ